MGIAADVEEEDVEVDGVTVVEVAKEEEGIGCFIPQMTP